MEFDLPRLLALAQDNDLSARETVCFLGYCAMVSAGATNQLSDATTRKYRRLLAIAEMLPPTRIGRPRTTRPYPV